MTVEADDPVSRRHDHMEVVRNKQDSTIEPVADLSLRCRDVVTIFIDVEAAGNRVATAQPPR